MTRKALRKYTVWRTLCGIYYVQHGKGAMNAELFENLRLELRRGCVVLAVLAALRVEHYGYTLRKALAERGMDIDEGTLYPLLRRLESTELRLSEWREEQKRNRRAYLLSSAGKDVLKELLSEWRQINASVTRIVGGGRSAA